MRALLFAEGGNLDHLFDSNSKVYQIIAENWVRAEKLMFKVDDENIRPPSPIRTVKRIAHLHMNHESVSDSVNEEGPVITAQELKELISRRDELIQLAEDMKKMKEDERAKALDRFTVGM